MKIQVLDRICSDWHELYVNGEIIYEGEHPTLPGGVLNSFLLWLGEQEDINLEFRVYHVHYEHNKDGEYEPPLRIMTGMEYWEDYEKAIITVELK